MTNLTRSVDFAAPKYGGRGLGLLLGLVGVLGACGDDGGETGDATPTASAGLSPSGTATTGESEGTDSTDPTATDSTSEPTTGEPTTTTDSGTTEPTTTGTPGTESESDSACDRALWYLDADGDGYGDPNQVESACEAPPGYVDNDLDCDDQDPELNPETAWYLDADGDGYGDPDDVIYQCEEPPDRVRIAGDCDDQNPEIGPHVAEATCGDQGTDLNCDGEPAPLCASCVALLEDAGIAEDGIYTVDPNGGDPDDALPVYCDMTTERNPKTHPTRPKSLSEPSQAPLRGLSFLRGCRTSPPEYAEFGTDTGTDTSRIRHGSREARGPGFPRTRSPRSAGWTARTRGSASDHSRAGLHTAPTPRRS